MPNPFDPNSYGMPSFEDLMVGALTEEAARAKMEADEVAMAAQLRQQQSQVEAMRGRFRAPGLPGNPMPPVQERADPGTVDDLGFNQSGAAKPYGTLTGPKGTIPLPPDVTAGQFGPAPGDFVGSHGHIDPREESTAYLREKSPLGMVTRASEMFDDVIQEFGWMPQDFKDPDGNPMSHAAAAARIADQLRTRRIRQLGENSPDWIQQLPVY